MGIGWTLVGAGAITYITDHVSIVPPQPTKTRVGVPGVEEVDVLRDTLLEGEPGQFANTHNVYLSTNFTDVNDGAAGALAAEGHIETNFDPGRLAFGETYYWRVDEVNSAPDFTVYNGKVWSFTVEPELLPVENVTATASSTFGASGPEKTVDGSGQTSDLYHGISSSRVRRLPTQILGSAEYKLDILNAACSLDDLRSPPGNRLELLRGEYTGFHSLRINQQWRIIFRWQDSNAHDVRIVDYH